MPCFSGETRSVRFLLDLLHDCGKATTGGTIAYFMRSTHAVKSGKPV
jgi:hypothetical protein